MRIFEASESPVVGENGTFGDDGDPVADHAVFRFRSVFHTFRIDDANIFADAAVFVHNGVFDVAILIDHEGLTVGRGSLVKIVPHDDGIPDDAIRTDDAPQTDDTVFDDSSLTDHTAISHETIPDIGSFNSRRRQEPCPSVNRGVRLIEGKGR